MDNLDELKNISKSGNRYSGKKNTSNKFLDSKWSGPIFLAAIVSILFYACSDSSNEISREDAIKYCGTTKSAVVSARSLTDGGWWIKSEKINYHSNGSRYSTMKNCYIHPDNSKKGYYKNKSALR